MQKHNVNLPIIVTARHMEVTDAIRDGRPPPTPGR